MDDHGAVRDRVGDPLLAQPEDLPRRRQVLLAFVALGFDTAVISAYLLVYNYENGTPIRQVMYLAMVEAAVRFAIVGPLVLTALTVPVLIEFEHLRAEHTGESFRGDYVTFQVGSQIIVGLIVGWLVLRLVRETQLSQERASEAEELRDALGRRVDVLEAANRCARALGSSLVLEDAFDAFIREVRGLVPFDRIAVVLVEGDRAGGARDRGCGRRRRLPARLARADRRLDLRRRGERADGLPPRPRRRATSRRRRSCWRSGCARASRRRCSSGRARSG